MYGVLHDWVPHAPLTIVSIILFILVPFFAKDKKNVLILLAVFILPISGLYLFCKLLKITHFVTSRYFINLLPLFLITIYLSLDTIQAKFEKLKRFIRLRLLFIILLIASNLMILPLYYQSEKQDLRGLVNFLKGQIKEGDKIIVGNVAFIPAILHYFGAYPKDRYHGLQARKISEEETEYLILFVYKNIKCIITYSESHWFQYFSDGSRLWIVADKKNGKRLKEEYACVLKGYFDGSFLNFHRFPTDASMYLFLWDPSSPNEKGIEMPIE
jgi:hypothetical protein